MAEKKLADLPPSYTNLGFDNEPIPGPSAPIDQDEHIMHSPTTDIADAAVPPYEDNASRIPDYKPPSLVFEDIYDACVQHVKKHCCYGSRFINRMKLTEIDNKRALHYTLESYGEKRETVIEYTPYRGGPIDGHGPVPDPWEMAIQRPTHFSNFSAKFQVPHTTHVNTCWRCDGLGKVTCSSCSGGGEEDCWHCRGRGRDDDGRCFSCSGTGKTECSSCSGTGKVTCKKCDGYGKIKDTKYLVVTWKNHPNDFVTYTNKLPQEYIRKAGGVVLFTETCSRLEPVTDAPDATVNAASASILRTHDIAFQEELIILQRHALKAVPFTRVTYQWKDSEGEFYVYGTERKVYFEDYPQKCCCCTCC